jgi:chromosome segregation protein
MKLKTLKLFGFKTFAESTTLEFTDGITAVVGPNGSGKSNFVDAIRWVLGEQSSRSLRSQKMEDVIFAGNTKRKPLGMAEVTVTFDNASGALPLAFQEVSITRRAYRAGDSEYFINRNSCRLRDVHELLMGTGLGPGSYAIVSQGQIDAILSSKPTERRALFEETAGIAKFLARKNEALRRLDGTETNVVRTSDLIAELERRAPELDGQVRRAKRYRKLVERVRDLELLQYVRASRLRSNEREHVAKDLERLDAEAVSAAARAATLGAELATLRSQTYTFELELEERRGEAQAARAALAQRESDAAATKARRDALDLQATRTVEDRERRARERAELDARFAQYEERLAPLRDHVEATREREAEATAAVAEARAALDAIYTELREVEAIAAERAASAAERRANVARAESDVARLERERTETAAALSRAETQVADDRGRYDALEAARAEAEDALAAQTARAGGADARAAAASTRVAELQTQYRAVSSELAGAESRLHTIEELEAQLEGHVPGTRAVIEAARRGQLRGVVGVVSELVEVDERYARALDVAFGAGLSNVVTETSEDAEAAVRMLREREAGRATFLPLDTLANREGHELRGNMRGRRGVFGYAHELVTCEPRYRGVVAYLVGRTLVVDELPTGIALVRGEGFRDSLVTLEGDQIMGGGAITGGRNRRERSILARRAQAQTLRDRVPQLRAQLEQIERDGLAAKNDLDAASAERNAARDAGKAAELALQAARTQLATLAAQIERLDAEAMTARAKSAAFAEALAEAHERVAVLARADDAAIDVGDRRAELEAALAAARTRIDASEGERTAAARAASTAREELARISAERDAAQTRIRVLDADVDRASDARESVAGEIAALDARLAAIAAELADLRAAVTAADERVTTIRTEREKLVDRSSQCEAEERIAQHAERDATASGEASRRRIAQIDAELGMLVQAFTQNPATDDELADVRTRYEAEPDTIVDELPRLRDEAARLAQNVNLNAENDRDEIAERERFLREQLADLDAARQTLLATIGEIEGQSQVQFNETFTNVAARFAETFARLFPGGTARMWQTNPERLAESGIEIEVQPPGKKMTHLPALSGGERAMTAAALIFALIKVKPSPFYLLDEVDAALDDANVDRLSGMVREVASEAQMLIVTHNKKTMELASRMYGVTMAEPGVSSIISATLDGGAVPAARTAGETPTEEPALVG